MLSNIYISYSLKCIPLVYEILAYLYNGHVVVFIMFIKKRINHYI